MRVAVYARYSSENQREASIDDQLRICKARITAEGWERRNSAPPRLPGDACRRP